MDRIAGSSPADVMNVRLIVEPTAAAVSARRGRGRGRVRGLCVCVGVRGQGVLKNDTKIHLNATKSII